MKKRSWGSIRKQMAMLVTATAMAMTSVVTVAPAITAHAEHSHRIEFDDESGAAKNPLHGSGKWTVDDGGFLGVYSCAEDNTHEVYYFNIPQLTPHAEKKGEEPLSGLRIGKQQNLGDIKVEAETGKAFEISAESLNHLALDGEDWEEKATEFYTSLMPYATIEFQNVKLNDKEYHGSLSAKVAEDKASIRGINLFEKPGTYTADVTVKITPTDCCNPEIKPFAFKLTIEVKGEEVDAPYAGDGRALILKKEHQTVTSGTTVSISVQAIAQRNCSKGSLYYFESTDGGATWAPYGERVAIAQDDFKHDNGYAEFKHGFEVKKEAEGTYLYGAVFFSDIKKTVNRLPLDDKAFVCYTNPKLIEYITAPENKDKFAEYYKDVLYVYETQKANMGQVDHDATVVVKNPPAQPAPQPTPEPQPQPQPQPQPEPVPEVLGVTRVQTPQTGLADKPMFYIVMMSISAAVAVTGIVIKCKNRAQRRRK